MQNKKFAIRIVKIKILLCLDIAVTQWLWCRLVENIHLVSGLVVKHA